MYFIFIIVCIIVYVLMLYLYVYIFYYLFWYMYLLIINKMFSLSFFWRQNTQFFSYFVPTKIYLYFTSPDVDCLLEIVCSDMPAFCTTCISYVHILSVSLTKFDGVQSRLLLSSYLIYINTDFWFWFIPMKVPIVAPIASESQHKTWNTAKVFHV